jgi:hypothetical protein
LLCQVGEREKSFSMPHGRGEKPAPAAVAMREAKAAGVKTRNIYFPDPRIGSGIRVKPRDFP